MSSRQGSECRCRSPWSDRWFSDELKAFGFKTDIAPDNDAFFMRPLISAMGARLTRSHPRGQGVA